MECNRPYREIVQKSNGNKKLVLAIVSDKLSSALSKLGGTPRKSLTLEFPKFIPKHLMSHFIRGYFDGDGSVWNGKRKKMIVKDERHPGKTREKQYIT